jgi:hypothetical protein
MIFMITNGTFSNIHCDIFGSSGRNCVEAILGCYLFRFSWVFPFKYNDHDYPFSAAYLPFVIIFPSHYPLYTLRNWKQCCKISEESVITIRIIRIKSAIHTAVTNIFKDHTILYCFPFVGNSSYVSRYRWPRGQRRRSAAAHLLGWWFRIPQGHDCLLWVLFASRVEVSATGRSLVQRSSRVWYV